MRWQLLQKLSAAVKFAIRLFGPAFEIKTRRGVLKVHQKNASGKENTKEDRLKGQGPNLIEAGQRALS